MVAELVEGDEVTFYEKYSNRSKKLKPGDYLYIPPKASFYFSSNGKVNMVLFEIK
jgi:mannose-6-phosphate isomerase-like protein (cupin superfamily)